MVRGRTAGTLFIVLAVVLAVVVFFFDELGVASWFSAGEPAASDGPALLDDRPAPAPGLETSKAPAATKHGADKDSSALPEDIWTIEIPQVVDAEGNPVRGADIYLDQARHTNETWTWDGVPVLIRMRLWADDDARSEENEREGWVEFFEDDPVVISARYDGFATWIGPALHPRGKKTTVLRPVLHPPRKLRGLVLAQDGDRAPYSLDDIAVWPKHAPRELFKIETRAGEDGRFSFDKEDELPSGTLMIEARTVHTEFFDGCAVSGEVEPGVEDVVLTLRRAHKFRFFVTIAEEEGGGALADRAVQFTPPGEAGKDVKAKGHFFPAVRERQLNPYTDVILPEGSRQLWRAVCPGYRAVDIELHATGAEREHEVDVRLEPEVTSGLLVLDVEGPGHAMRGMIYVHAMEPGGERGAARYWRARWRVRGVPRTKAAVRLPSGVRKTIRLDAGIDKRSPSNPWMISPFDIVLKGGERIDQKVQIVRGGTLSVYRKRKGGLMPDLHVRVTQGSIERTWNRWFDGGEPTGGRAYLMIHALEPGTWELELVREGRVLPWSQTVRVESGKTATVRIPDEVVLPKEDR